MLECTFVQRNRSALVAGKLLIIITLAFLIISSSFSLGAIGDNEQKNTKTVRDEDRSNSSYSLVYKASLEIEDINKLKEEYLISEEYPSYYLVNIDRKTRSDLEEDGIVIEDFKNHINLPSGEKRTDRMNSFNDIRLDDGGFYIIKFVGPLKNEWKDELGSTGIDIYERLGERSFLCKGRSDLIKEIESEKYIIDILPYRGEYKISSYLYENVLSEEEEIEDRPIELKVRVDKELGAMRLSSSLMKLRGRLLSYSDTSFSYRHIKVKLPISKIEELAERSFVISISETSEYMLMNHDSSWVTQSYDLGDNNRTVWERGIYGQDQIVGIADTGLDYDHAAFRDREYDAGTPGPSHRKVVSYTSYANSNDTDYSGHGTHVSGSVAGDRGVYGVPDSYDGMAPAAKIAFFDIGGSGDSLIVPDDLKVIFQDQYDNGARVFSNSWGGSSSDYTTDSEAVDQFMWEHNDALILFASGNSGPESNTVANPASAKNIVSVGNAINGESEDMAASSSNGPTDHGRLKPTVSAPGTAIISSDSDGDLSTLNSEYIQMTGTSMATPITAGATALIRQYYTDGFYPSGEGKSVDGFTPSGALMKATLINSAWNMKGEYTDEDIPSNGQGWGKIKLDEALHFKGDGKHMSVLSDGGSGGFTTSGYEDVYEIFADDGEELKFTLVWTDYPGSALQNDLDLTVEAPDGTQYFGNVFDNGHSISGGTHDDNNVSEQVLLDIPSVQEGRYTVKVTADSITQGPQRYALLTTGELSQDKGKITFGQESYNVPPVDEKIDLKVLDSNRNQDPYSVDTLNVDVSSNSQTTAETITLSETSSDSGIFGGDIDIYSSSSGSSGDLLVSENDTVTVEYNDNDPSFSCVESVEIDSVGPKVTDIQHPNVEDGTLGANVAEISWTTDEETVSKIDYGTTRDLDESQWSDIYSIEHSAILDNLSPNTTYYYKITSVDGSGSQNAAVDSNGGALHTFKTTNEPILMGDGYSGYAYSVSTNEKGIFDRSYITCGYYYAMGFFGPKEGAFYGSVMFDTSHVDVDQIESARLRLYPHGNYQKSIDDQQWRFEVLSDNIENYFPDPSYSQIEGATAQFNMGYKQASEVGSALEIVELDVPEENIADLKSNMKDGRIVVRMAMDDPVDHIDMVEWYSGHHASGEDILKAPRLMVDYRKNGEGTVEFERKKYSEEDHVHVTLIDEDMNQDPDSRGSIDVDLFSSSESKTITLEETGSDSSIFKGSIRISSSRGLESDILSVSGDGEIRVEYYDGSSYETKKDTAGIDGAVPVISEVSSEAKNDLTSTITWTTDEESNSKVVFGGTEIMTEEKTDYDYVTQHSVTLHKLVKSETYYYRVVSQDRAGNEKVEPSDGSFYTFTTPSSNIQPSILVIDDAGHESNYLTSLDNNGLIYDFESIGDSELPTSNLKDYDITLWILDGFSKTLTTDEQNLISSYLDDGGHLYINGEDIGFDIGDTQFYTEYMHAVYLNDSVDSTVINGISGDDISDGHQDLAIGGDYSSEVEPADDDTSVTFRYGNGKSAGLRTSNGEHKLVYFAFEYFEGGDEQSVKDSLMADIIEWMDPRGKDEYGAAVGGVSLSSTEIDWNSTVKVTGMADELVSYGSNITKVEYFIDVLGDEDHGYQATPSDGSFDSNCEDFEFQLDGCDLSSGLHNIYIRAKDEMGNWGDAEEVAISVDESSIDLQAAEVRLQSNVDTDGWNFISTELIPSDKALDHILNDDQNGISGGYEKVMYYDAGEGRWKTYVPGRAEHFNDDIQLDQTMGLWIQASVDCNLTIEGHRPTTTTITLYPGWNMVGYPSEINRKASDTLPAEITKIGVLDGSAENNVAYHEDLSTVTLSAGKGYWTYNSGGTSIDWTVDY